MKKYMIILSSFLVLIIAGIFIYSEMNPSYTSVSGEEVRGILVEDPEAVFIYVKDPEDADLKIEDSYPMSLEQIETAFDTDEIDKNINIIVYSNNGTKSRDATKILASLGYKNIYDMGSYENW